MRCFEQVDGKLFREINTEFVDMLNKYRNINDIETLDEMIEKSRFYVDGGLYEFRYSEDPILEMYDLYREWEEDRQQRYSLLNPDDYKITGFLIDIENNNRFIFKLDYNLK